MRYFWVVKRGDMYLTFDRVFRIGQKMARRFCCAGDARPEASAMTMARVVRVRATKGTNG